MSTESLFHFTEIRVSKMTKELSSLNSKKARTFGNIPTRVLKTSSNICNKVLQKNAILGKHYIPQKLKFADITPAYKKKDPTLAENYRLVSVLPTVSRVFERIIQKELSTHTERFLSPYFCGNRKRFSTQFTLTSLIEKWKKCLDNKGYTGAVLMDLSKAFNTINHELLIARLHAYGFSKDSLFIRSLLKN